jgi:hypothetical protein
VVGTTISHYEIIEKIGQGGHFRLGELVQEAGFKASSMRPIPSNSFGHPKGGSDD